MEKETRSEYVGLYMTPTMAKQVKEAGNNEQLKDKLIKQFVTNEIGWLTDEISEMDNITVRYRARLLTIRDKFTEAQDIYVSEIETLINKTEDAMKPLNGKFNSLKSEIEQIKNSAEGVSKVVDSLSAKIGYIDYSRIERLLDAVDRFNKMSDSEKELIRLVISNEL
ncbi:MAG: hypothetical protein ACYC5G_06220 [Candidatus Doudnabacteria bacterium]